MIQSPLFQPAASWEPPRLSTLPSWRDAKRVGFDLETHDPDIKTLGIGVRRNGRVIGISFAIEDGPSHYLPIGHSEGNLPAELVWQYLKDQAACFRGILVGANLGYDLDYCQHNGLDFTKATIRDVQVADPLINELHDSYSLESLAQRYDLPGKDETTLREAAKAWGLDPKKNMAALPSRFVGGYAAWDAELPLKILRRQERIIDEQELWEIFDLESKVLPVLVRMRRRGVRVSWERLEAVEAWAIEQAKLALAKVREETGARLDWRDVWKPDAIAKPLLETGVVLERRKDGKHSVDKATLEALDRAGNPVAKHLSRARVMNKVSTTFVESIRKHAIGDRIHATFNQLRMNPDESEGGGRGARYGRLSSTDPNMQQQPARHPEIGPRWRAIYIPDDGGLWACDDYSQQEPRMLTHYAELCRLPRAAEMAEKYRRDPKADNHDMMTELIYGEGIKGELPKKEFKRLRDGAKIIFLGKCYGMGGGKLCRSLGKPTEWVFSSRLGKMIEVAGAEGKAIIDQFDSQLPFVRLLADRCEQHAAKKGYVRTILGRRCRFPQKGEGFDWTHKALNRLIQGSSADQTKAAMVQLDAEGFGLQLQVHDEIDLTVSSWGEAEAVADVMRNCVKLNVPSRVDVEVGPSWGEVKGRE